MHSQLDSYIVQARQAGQADEQIRQALVQSGWTQEHINQAFGLSQAPSAPVMPTPPQMPGAAQPIAGDFFDQKTKDTVMWSVIGYLIKSVVVGLATAIAANMFFSSINVYGINVPVHQGFYFNFTNVIFSSIIGGLVFGIILAKYFSWVQDINRKYFNNWFKDLYSLIFYPAIIAGVLGLLFAGSFSFLGGQFFLYLVTIVIGDVAGSYIFAKLMVSKVGHYYPVSNRLEIDLKRNE